jgi:hypothetical protein
MATLLSSLGVTSSIPDPAAYKNVMDEVTNMMNVRNMTQSTLERINKAIDTAVAERLPRTYIDKLDELANEITNLQTANLGAAATATKFGDIENRLAVTLKEQEAAVQKQRISDLNSLKDTVTARLKGVEHKEIKKEYEKLLNDVSESLEAAKDPSLQGKSFESLKDTLARLDEQNENDDNKVFNWARFRVRILNIMMRGLLIISLFFGFLFGGIIMSNAYAEDYFWGIKLFYFIYGAAFFPLSLFYGMYYKPYWVSGLIPLYSIDPRIVPTVAIAPSAIKTLVNTTSVKTDVANILTTVQKDSNNILKSVTGILPPHKGGADSLTISQRLFGYRIVNPIAVTPEQTSSQNTLHKITIVEIVLLSIVSLYYGVSKVLGKGALTFGSFLK